MSGNDNKKNNISDEELSLISIIANLENKLEELDHNISLLSKDNPFEKINSVSNNVILKKIHEIENNISRMEYSSRFRTRFQVRDHMRGHCSANMMFPFEKSNYKIFMHITPDKPDI